MWGDKRHHLMLEMLHMLQQMRGRAGRSRCSTGGGPCGLAACRVSIVAVSTD